MATHHYIPAIYTVSIEVQKSPEHVFTQVIDLASWWPEEFLGESLKPNSEFVLQSGGGEHYSKNKVIEWIPAQKFTWLTLDSIRKSDDYHWTGTKFIFELTPKSDGTLVRVTYDGIVGEHDYNRMVQACDLTIKDFLYKFITSGKEK